MHPTADDNDKIKYDDILFTTEEWQYMARCVSVCGDIIIIIITNEEIIVAFSPKTTRTRYKVKKNKTARYTVSSKGK